MGGKHWAFVQIRTASADKLHGLYLYQPSNPVFQGIGCKIESRQISGIDIIVILELDACSALLGPDI